MKYEAGNRFNPETYLKTEAESGTTVSLKVTGELEGVEVSFDSGDVPELTSLSATENRTYEAPEGTAYNEVTVNVPNSYTAEDAGKVVVEGALVAQTSTTKTANGTYNTTTNNEVVVEVANSYTAADEGKVVSSGALVAQTSRTVTANDTYDTTTNNEVVVAVPGPSGSINITQNDTYDVTQYASAVVNVSGGSSQDTNSLILLFDGGTSGATPEDLIIPEGVTIMRERCMQSYFGSVNLILPSTITTIRDSAMMNATGIKSITCKAVNPPTVGTNALSGIYGSVQIYVPAASVETYKTASGWSTFASSIQAIPTT